MRSTSRVRSVGLCTVVSVTVALACGRVGFDPQDALVSNADARPCPASYVPIVGLPGRYRVLGQISYRAGVNACGADGQAPFVVVDDATAKALADLVGAGSGWAGIDGGVDGFVTARGQAATFLPWGQGQPADPGETCVRLLPGPAPFFETDVMCENEWWMMCECVP